jgi:hypothetical protein
MIQQFRLYREVVLINGWHYNEYESAAMWNLYSHENAGIAIQSTTTKLSKCFEDNKKDTIWIGKVQYLYASADLQTLIENVYIAPYAESWFKELVESLLSKYQLNVKVMKSDLYIQSHRK